jgi:ethanolamine utilization protein EutP (predicted NTPase)
MRLANRADGPPVGADGFYFTVREARSERVSSSTEERRDRPEAAGVPALVDAVSALLALPAGLLGERTRADLADARERTLERRLNVAVVGEFKRGKSTLVNALLGVAVVPTGVLPLTSAVTLVREGPAPRLVVRFGDGRAEEHPLERLAGYATEAGNPGNALGVELTIVETPSRFLAGGLQVIDTPGIGSVHAHNTHAAQTFFPRIDAAVVVLGADQPLSAAERDLLATVGETAGAVVVVANRIDRLGEDDRALVLSFLAGALADAGGKGEVLAVSATEGTGVAELRDALARLAGADAGAVAAAARRGAVVRAAAAARSAATLEAHALELPRAEIELRAARFAAQVDALLPAREAAAAALDRSLAEVLRDGVAAPLRGLAAEQAPRLAAELERQAAARPGSPRALRRDLDGWVEERVRACIEAAGARIEASVSAELERLADRYAAHVAEVLARIADGVAEAFGERPHWTPPRIALAQAAPFHYKLRDEGEGLGDAVSAARALAPGRAGRRLVLREAQERLGALLDRHAGRLRHQLDERALAAIAGYRRELADTVEAAVAGVQAAAERGRSELDRGAAHAAARRAELGAAIARCDRIAADLAAADDGWAR